MRCLPESYLQVQQFFARDEGALQDRVRQACVTLEAPGFRGAGVLCKLEQDAHLAERAMIATSKSNLLRLAGWDPAQAPPAFTDYAIKPLLAAFVAKVAIRQDELLAAIDHLAVFANDWGHDLLLLLSRDPELIRRTQAHGCFANLDAIQRHRRYFAGLQHRPFHYLQCGADWDPELTQVPPDLPCRLTHLLDREPQNLTMSASLGQSRELFRLEADVDSTLTEGDQGGALFAAYNEKGQEPELYLHAINTTSDADPQRTVTLNTVTSCRAIIERTYTQLDHGV